MLLLHLPRAPPHLVLHGVHRVIVEAGGRAGHAPVRGLRGDGPHAGQVLFVDVLDLDSLVLHREAREEGVTVREWEGGVIVSDF